MFSRALRRGRLILGIVLVSALCPASPTAQTHGGPPDGSQREQWQMPVRVMDEIGVRPGMTVADVGAGDGWFSFYLADRVGSTGRVIAEDIDARAIESVRERCAERRVSNISVLVGEMEDPKLPAGSVDMVLMVNVLSALDAGAAKTFLANLATGLKPDGRLVIIDWDPVKDHQATAREFEPQVRRTLRLLRDADFEVVNTLDFLPRQSLRICRWRGRD